MSLIEINGVGLDGWDKGDVFLRLMLIDVEYLLVLLVPVLEPSLIILTLQMQTV